jgi:aconitate hydratase
MPNGTRNTIVSSFNRNFPARNDGNKETLSFIGSPDTVVALALAGRLDFDFTTQTLTAPDGSEVKLEAPVADDLPSRGFDQGASGFVAPAADAASVEVQVKEGSDRLELLQPFPAWDGKDFLGLRVLLKAVGKCTTDHISPAGPWLSFRGHLTNISGNMFIGANNAFADKEPGLGVDFRDGSITPLPELAREYKAAGIPWIAVGDENWGEGSSREHAAMEPRYMGCKVILVRSFARIHEANLKKQGVLPLTFIDPTDYTKVLVDDTVDVINLAALAPGEPVTVVLHHADGGSEQIVCNHTMSPEHIGWFKAGSALNLLATR